MRNEKESQKMEEWSCPIPWSASDFHVVVVGVAMRGAREETEKLWGLVDGPIEGVPEPRGGRSSFLGAARGLVSSTDGFEHAIRDLRRRHAAT